MFCVASFRADPIDFLLAHSQSSLRTIFWRTSSPYKMMKFRNVLKESVLRKSIVNASPKKRRGAPSSNGSSNSSCSNKPPLKRKSYNNNFGNPLPKEFHLFGGINKVLQNWFSSFAIENFSSTWSPSTVVLLFHRTTTLRRLAAAANRRRPTSGTWRLLPAAAVTSEQIRRTPKTPTGSITYRAIKQFDFQGQLEESFEQQRSAHFQQAPQQQQQRSYT